MGPTQEPVPAMPPQPPMQPVQPPQPVMQQAPQPMPMQQPQYGAPMPGQMPYAQSPKKGLSKGVLWGIIGGAIALVLIIVGVVLALVVFGPPSKGDYQKAYDKAQSMTTKYNAMSASTFSDDLKNAKTDSDVDAAVDKIKAEYDKDNIELAGMKAMNDSEVKKAFDAYKTKYDAAFPIIKQMMKSTLVYTNVAKSCSYSNISYYYDTSASRQAAYDKYDAKSKDCVELLNKYKSSSDSKVADFATKYLAYISKMRTYLGDYAEASAAKDYNKLLALDMPSSSDLPYISDLTKDLTSTSSYDFTTQFNDFMSVLVKKK